MATDPKVHPPKFRPPKFRPLRLFAAALAGILVLLAAAPPPAAAQEEDAGEELLARARAVLERVPLIDGHNDFPWQVRERAAGKLSGLELTDDLAASADSSGRSTCRCRWRGRRR